MRRRLLAVAADLALIAYFVFALFPVAWMVVLSLKPTNELFSTYFSFTPTLDSYRTVLGAGDDQGVPFLRFFVNSLVVSLGAVALSLVIGLPAAYAAARWRFRGSENLMFTLLSFRFAPELTVIIPLFVLYQQLGLFDTYVGMVWVLQLVTLPLIVWIMRSYFSDLSPELEQAALLDGYTRKQAPQAGTVELDGADMAGVEPYDRGVAMCFESYALYPHRTAYDNLASPLRSPRHRLPAHEAHERIGEIAELLGIGALLDRQVGRLSNGQRQRVALGRVLVRPARAFLLDEPLSHLDAKLRQAMRAELRAIGAVRRTTTLYVTHDSVEALALGDRIGVIREGRMVQTGTREELWHRPYDTFVARSFGRPRINLLPGTVTPEGHFRSPDGAYELPLAVPAPPGTAVRLGLRPRDIGLGGPAGTGGGGPVLELTGAVHVTELLGRATEVTVRIGGQRLSLVVPRAEAAGLSPDHPVRLSVAPESLLLFEADRPARPGRRIST